MLQTMRDNADMLVNNLEVFIHDPILDFSRKKAPGSKGTQQDFDVDEAQRCIHTVRRKLNGYVDESLPLSSHGQVEELIRQATSAENLSKMFVGWAPFL